MSKKMIAGWSVQPHSQTVSRELTDPQPGQAIRSQEDIEALYLKLLFVFNLRQPVSSLPPEILLHIFSLLKLPEHSAEKHPVRSSWIAVTHVSKHWRKITLECPSLWRNVTSQFGIMWLKEMIRRTHDIPFSVSLPYWPPPCPFNGSYPWQHLEELLANCLPRVQQLSIYCHTPGVHQKLVEEDLGFSMPLAPMFLTHFALLKGSPAHAVSKLSVRTRMGQNRNLIHTQAWKPNAEVATFVLTLSVPKPHAYQGWPIAVTKILASKSLEELYMDEALSVQAWEYVLDQSPHLRKIETYRFSALVLCAVLAKRMSAYSEPMENAQSTPLQELISLKLRSLDFRIVARIVNSEPRSEVVINYGQDLLQFVRLRAKAGAHFSPVNIDLTESVVPEHFAAELRSAKSHEMTLMLPPPPNPYNTNGNERDVSAQPNITRVKGMLSRNILTIRGSRLRQQRGTMRPC
ncbi:hypothetical protein FA95DRAFT_1575202 [Auriscalpium vulgare]|uniref:Uncharacterized protein n=1 Tax=Auriscalpium vulgare TaxID=40419 RepID=A0ACB8RH96_9AGAM|nr:hypothetical protein FA95DRAFT_1575202 [Auriscalpium vulgare]